MDALVQYLLAMSHPAGGGQVFRYGVIDLVLLYAPYQVISYEFSPPTGTYAYIAFNYRESPYVVPGAILFEAWQSGIQFNGAVIAGAATEEPKTSWIVVTRKQPSLTKATNLTGLWQEEEFGQEFIIVQSESDYQMLLQAIRDWYSNYGIIAAIKELEITVKSGGK